MHSDVEMARRSALHHSLVLKTAITSDPVVFVARLPPYAKCEVTMYNMTATPFMPPYTANLTETTETPETPVIKDPPL